MNNYQCVQAIGGNLGESFPIFSATYADDFSSHQDYGQFRPPNVYNDQCYQNYNYCYDHFEKSDDDVLSYWQNEKLVPVCESIVDQADTVTSYCQDPMNNFDEDDDVDTCFDDFNPTIIIQSPGLNTTTINDAVVPSSGNQQQYYPTGRCNIRASNDADYISVPDIAWNTGNPITNDICYMKNGVVDMDNFVVPSYPIFGAGLRDTNDTNTIVPHHFPPDRNKGKEKVEKQTILHNKAERKRRNKINQRLEVLKKLVPNIRYKTDKATMLDQVIEYIKKLQTQQQNNDQTTKRIGMINNMTYPMMIPVPYYMFMQQQQQLQMSMMDNGMNMDPGVDSMETNPFMHPNMNSVGNRTPSVVHPTSLIPSSSSSYDF